MRERTGEKSFVFVVPWPVDSVGGVNEVVLNLALQLARTSLWRPVIVISRWDVGPSPIPVRGCEVVHMRLRDPLSAGGLRGSLAALACWPFDSYRLLQFLRSRNAAVVNVHFPGLNAGPLFILKLFRLFQGKLLLSFHGSDLTAMAAEPGWKQAIWRRIIKLADAAIACSRDLAGGIRSFAPAARVEMIPNGADLSLFTRRPPSEFRGRSILHIGKYEHKKSQDILLQAFRLVLEDIPSARLVLVGASGPALPQTRQIIDSLHLEQHVSVNVDVPHHRIPEFMSQADLFVLPSRSEPFGIVLLEAGAAGLPVIASRVGGIPELLDHGSTGLLVEPEDVLGLATAMKGLLLNRGEAIRLAQAWHEKATLDWSWEKTCGRYLSLIETLDSPSLPPAP